MSLSIDQLLTNSHAHEQHGDDTLHGGAFRRGSSDSDFEAPGTKVRAEHAHSDERAGKDNDQERIDSYRAAHAGLGTKLDRGHPQDRSARADQYAHAPKETYGHAYKRGGQSGEHNR